MIVSSHADPNPTPSIAALDPVSFRRNLDRLAQILEACVREGASVGFVLPFARAEARAYWREKSAPPLKARSRLVLAATVGGEVVGTAQLDLDGMPSKRHHAEVSKVLVDPRFRRAGVARALMADIERRAAEAGPMAPDPRHRRRRRRDALPFAGLRARRNDPALRAATPSRPTATTLPGLCTRICGATRLRSLRVPGFQVRAAGSRSAVQGVRKETSASG